MSGSVEHVVSSAPGMGDLIALINIGVVVGIIVLAGRKGIQAFLKSRSHELSKNLVQAKVELDATLKQIESARAEIADIDSIKSRMILQVQEEAEKLSKQILFEANTAAARILSDAKLAAKNEMTSATMILKKHLVQASIESAVSEVKGLSGQELKLQLHNTLVEHLIEDIRKVTPPHSQGRTSNGH